MWGKIDIKFGGDDRIHIHDIDRSGILYIFFGDSVLRVAGGGHTDRDNGDNECI